MNVLVIRLDDSEILGQWFFRGFTSVTVSDSDLKGIQFNGHLRKGHWSRVVLGYGKIWFAVLYNAGRCALCDMDGEALSELGGRKSASI
jgi:hypothetical protein